MLRIPVYLCDGIELLENVKVLDTIIKKGIGIWIVFTGVS